MSKLSWRGSFLTQVEQDERASTRDQSREEAEQHEHLKREEKDTTAGRK